MGRAFVLRPGEGRSIDLGGFRMSVKATHEDTSGAFTLLEADEPANFGPPLHIHRDAAEAFYVLAGEHVLFIEGREHKSGHVEPDALSEIALTYGMDVRGPVPEGYA